jgi:MFS superfamily sulfate permease-like transporter
MVIAASQLGKVLGVPVEGGSFFAQVWSALRQLGDANPATVALALGGLGVLLALRRWAPSVPGPLVVVVGGIALVGLTDLERRGVALWAPGCSRPTRRVGAPPRPRSTTGPGPGRGSPGWSPPAWPCWP